MILETFISDKEIDKVSTCKKFLQVEKESKTEIIFLTSTRKW